MVPSAHLAYLSHRNRWGRTPHVLDGTSFALAWLPGGVGIGTARRPTR